MSTEPPPDFLTATPPPPDRVPPLLPASSPRLATPPVLPGSPPASRPSLPGRQLLVLLLSLCLGLFLVDAFASLADDSLILFAHSYQLAGFRGLAGLGGGLVTLLVYGLMGLTPLIPKRYFLPLTLFGPVAQLAVLPCLIYHPGRLHEIVWGIAIAQLLFGLAVLYWVQGSLRLRWPLVAERQLGKRGFSWLNLSGFALMNVFGVLPAVGIYLLVCAGLAVQHFSDGFLALRPGGLMVQVRKYVRADGKMVQLVPMAHVGEPEFYRQLVESFPTNSIILAEGVTDNQNLLTNRISYRRMAATLGLAEQQREFKPVQGEWVSADVDVAQFAGSTIDFLNVVMRIHSQGLNMRTLLELLQYSPPPQAQERLLEDLLTKRNQHLLGELETRLGQSENIIIPWGAAHIPEIARAIQKSGFRLAESHEYMAVGFHAGGTRRAVATQSGRPVRSKK
jgi:hypothetical protein